MCQIIAMRSTGPQELLKDIKDHEKQFCDLLELKGEDYFSVGILASNKVNTNPTQVSLHTKNTTDLFSSLKKILAGESLATSTNIGIILFSRQKPEMERELPETQPYFIREGMIAVHGTIINDKELATARDLNIEVDTEVFRTYAIGDDRVKGTFSCIQITNQLNIVTRDNGLKLWRANIKGSETSVVSTGNLDFLDEKYYEVMTFPVRPKEDRILFASFSGGMDIALSTYKALSSGQYKKVILNYFDWGSNAADEELKTLNDFAKYYSNVFSISAGINIVNCGAYFDNFFDIAGVQAKIADREAEGEAGETEAPIAYVPYRNSQFAMLLASIAEAKEYKDVDILFGLNLSEGMVFGDNSEGWLNAIQETIRYGGKSFSITGGYNVIAPFFPRTKTNMIKEFRDEFGLPALTELLSKSYSCYYPRADGSPCGKCGSCILRAKAEEELCQ